ncbi:MAG: hypothetical protein ACRCVU_20335 [Flavobacterium sp.]
MQPNRTYIIKRKDSGEMFRAASGKTSWKAPGHAKNAWNQTVNRWNAQTLGVEMIDDVGWRGEGVKRVPLFSEQDVYEVVELKLETETVLDEAKYLLNECLGRCEYDIRVKIEKFLKENT